MLKFVIGYSADIITAKERAIYFFNQVEGRTKLEWVESQIGQNEIGQSAWFTTIWYSEVPDPVEPKKQEEKFEYIGSTEIDPSDPNWREKWQAQQDALKEQVEILENAETDWFLNTDDFEVGDVIMGNEEHPLQGV